MGDPMKRQSTIFDHLFGFVARCALVVIAILFFNGANIDIKVTKKPNSLISTAGEAIDNAYSTFTTVKNFIN